MIACLQVSDGKIGIHDREVQKQVHLTTADLRFADCIVKAVLGDENNLYVSRTGMYGRLHCEGSVRRCQYRYGWQTAL